MRRPTFLIGSCHVAIRLILAVAYVGTAIGGVAPGYAACLPDPAPSGGAVSCTGTDANGFSAGSSVNLTVTVQPGATVSNAGSAPALNLTSGNIVTSAGSITSTVDAVRVTSGNTLQLLPAASIGSGRIGISASGTGNTITNSGSILTSGSAGDDGIRASANNNTITNAATGTITARLDGIDARSGTAAFLQQILNAGTISAGQVGIRVLDFNAIANSGQITAGSDAVIIRNNNVFANEAGASLASGRIGVSLTGSGNVVLNEGAISTSGAAGDDGIRAAANSNTITNAATGAINARLDGIDARSGTAAVMQQVLNAGTISAGQVGIRVLDFSAVTNSGQITAGSDGVIIRSNDVFSNEAGASLASGRIGVSITGSGNAILNEGAITTSGSSGDDGIRASANSNTITNAATGTINARIDGIDVRSGTALSRQQLSNAGTITAGQDAIRALDFSDVTNDGTIAAGQDGIELRSNNTIVNGIAGSITAAGAGVRLTGSNNTLLNQGSIASSASAGVAITGSSTNAITNDGVISGPTLSILGGNGSDVVVNSGTLSGAVSLGNGSDQLTLASAAALNGGADGGGGTDDMILDGAGTFGGAIARFETLTKTGAGAWRLTGGPSSVATTTVAGGELIVDGSLATQLTVLAGAALSGSGAINGNVNSTGGTVSPGGPTGTLAVSGNYTSDANSTFRVAIDDAGGGGTLSISGSALLDGRLEIDPLPGDYSGGGQAYDLLIADAGVTGQFDVTVVTQPLRYLLEYLADRVRLTTLSDFAALAQTHNQRAVARYLDEISPTAGSDLATVFTELSLLANEDVPNALDQLHPELYSAYDAASFASTRRLNSATEARLAGIGQELYGQSAALAEPQLAAASPATDPPLGDWIAAAPTGAAWISAAGGSIDQDDRDEHLGYEARSFDLVTGADARLAEGLIAGLAFSASATRIDWDDQGSTGEVNGLAGALYVAHLDSRLRLGALAGYGYDRYDTDRVIEFGGIDREAESRYGADRLFGSVDGTYALLRRDGWAADATAALSFIRLATEEFEETGAGALNLRVEDRTHSSLRSEIGVTVARAIAVGPDKTVTPHLSLGWAHEFLEDGAEIDSAFTGLGATFAVEGADEPKDRLLIGTGVTLQESENLAVTLDYEGEIGSDRLDNSIRLGVALRL